MLVLCRKLWSVNNIDSVLCILGLGVATVLTNFDGLD